MSEFVCERCGYPKLPSISINYTAATPMTSYTVPSGAPSTVSLDLIASRTMTNGIAIQFCTCPPEPKPKPKPKPKHDGMLSDTGTRVLYYELAPPQGISIEGRFYDGHNDVVVLMPDEALSLLAWLEQERETLEQLAKESAK